MISTSGALWTLTLPTEANESLRCRSTEVDDEEELFEDESEDDALEESSSVAIPLPSIVDDPVNEASIVNDPVDE
jgi:hypothetical protein